MKKLVNIAFQGGTHGNYLRFCIDKFSRLTPALVGMPFTNDNTSHNLLNYSGSVSRYHPKDDYPYFQNTNEPHILITVEEEDLLFLERYVTVRAGDYKIDVSSDLISLHSNFLKSFKWTDKFQKYYNIDLSKDRIPKFIMRDFYKLSFMDTSKSGFIKADRILRKNKPSNTFEFPVSCFWDKVKFSRTLEKMDKQLHLEIDINSCLPVHDTFLDGLPLLKTKQRSQEVIKALQDKQDINIQNLDTVEQAYLSAWIEKNHQFVLVPLSNNFFSTTGEIIRWLECYPQHYKAMNPNLPTFNNIPNPFHLWNSKK